MFLPLFHWYARERYLRELQLAAKAGFVAGVACKWSVRLLCLLVGLVAGLLMAASLVAAGLSVEAKGMLGGPDVEGGYFELQTREGVSGHEVILMTPIRSPLYPALRDLVGRDVVVSVKATD